MNKRMTALREGQGLWIGAGLITLGAGFMILKGLVRMSTGGDPSLVPWFGLMTTLGLTVVSFALTEEHGRSWLLMVTVTVSVTGVGASAAAVAFLITGSIPETPGAPAGVGVSYGLLAAAAFLSLGLLGATVASRRLLVSGWRWVPLAVLVAQFPIFVLAEAIGDVAARESVTDGLALTSTCAAWALAAYSFTRQPDHDTHKVNP